MNIFGTKIPYGQPIPDPLAAGAILDKIYKKDSKFESVAMRVAHLLASVESLPDNSHRHLVEVSRPRIVKILVSLQKSKAKFLEAISQGYAELVKSNVKYPALFSSLFPPDFSWLGEITAEWDPLLKDSTFLIPLVKQIMPGDKSKLLSLLMRPGVPEDIDFALAIVPASRFHVKGTLYELDKDQAFQLTKAALSYEISNFQLTQMVVLRQDNLACRIFGVFCSRIGNKWLVDLFRTTIVRISAAQSIEEVDIESCCNEIMTCIKKSWPKEENQAGRLVDMSSATILDRMVAPMPTAIYELLKHIKIDLENKKQQLLASGADREDVERIFEQMKYLSDTQLILRVVGPYLAKPRNWGNYDPKIFPKCAGKIINALKDLATTGKFSIEEYEKLETKATDAKLRQIRRRSSLIGNIGEPMIGEPATKGPLDKQPLIRVRSVQKESSDQVPSRASSKEYFVAASQQIDAKIASSKERIPANPNIGGSRIKSHTTSAGSLQLENPNKT